MSGDQLFATGEYDRELTCAVCASTEHATAECWAGQAPTLDLQDDEYDAWVCDHCGATVAVGTPCRCGCTESSWLPISPHYVMKGEGAQ